MLSWRALLFFSVAPLLAILAIMTVTVKTDLSAFVLSGGGAEEMLLASEMQSGALSRRYLISIDTGSHKQMTGLWLKSFIHQLKTLDGVREVWPANEQRGTLEALQSLYRDYGQSLYSRTPEVDPAPLFTQEALTKRAENLKQALLSPQAAIIKKIAEHDPLLLTLTGFQTVAATMQTAIKPANQFHNLILETEAAGLDVPQQQHLQQAIKQTFQHLNSHNYRLDMTGVPVFAVATQKLLQGDITWVSVLSTTALLMLFGWLFRSISALFQVFTLLTIVIIGAVLTTNWLFGYIHGMTIAIGSTLLGICIDYPIHAIVHARRVVANERAKTIARIWPSLILGGVTTLIGYTALGLSGYPGFQQVAVFAGAGIIGALLLTRFILPALIIGAAKPTINMAWAQYWSEFCQRNRLHLWLLLGVLTLASAWGLQSLRWLQDMQDLTPELNYLKDHDRRIRARMISIEPGRFILISGKNIESALQHAEQIYPILDRLQQQGALTDYFGLYPWLLSARQQQLNQQRLNAYLTPENQALWQQALQQQGLSVERLGHLNYPAQSAITVEQVFATPVKRLLDSRVLITQDKTLLIIWLGNHQPSAVQQALSAYPAANYFSQRDILNSVTAQYQQQAQILLAAGLGIILLLLIVRYKSVWQAVQTLAPATLAAFLILGLWAYTDARISFLHLTGLLLVISLCVDYGIFYQENRSGNLPLTYQAMAASMLTSALAFSCLTTADSTALRILASVVTIGVMLGFLLCPLLIRHHYD